MLKLSDVFGKDIFFKKVKNCFCFRFFMLLYRLCCLEYSVKCMLLSVCVIVYIVFIIIWIGLIFMLLGRDLFVEYFCL